MRSARVGIGIALAIVAVLLLLHHFGKLDDIWNAIKETANQFLEDIQPALKSLSDALGEMGIKIEQHARCDEDPGEGRLVAGRVHLQST
jgi:hypothetical protein